VAHRVAYVIGELSKGGAEYQLVELIRHLDPQRYHPMVFVLAEGGYWTGRLRDLGVEVLSFPRQGSADIGRLRRLRAALRAYRPDVLHTVLWSANVYGRSAALGLGIPAVIAAERNVIRRPPWQRRLERLLDRWTHAYLVNSVAIRTQLVASGRLAADKITVIHNGIDLAPLPAFSLDRTRARQALGMPPDRRLVAQVGRLTAQKDYPTFLAAMETVLKQMPDVDALIIGEGEDRDALRARAAATGHGERIRFLGLRHDVPQVLAAVDVLALTSQYEGLPNVVIEAMATGAVPVVTDVGGCRELVTHGESGFVVPPGDPAAVASAVSAVLGDAALAARMATAARAHVEATLAVEAMAASTMAVYDARLAANGLRH
jgi:glycosyltransferase involved in cell wall biosynthesis